MGRFWHLTTTTTIIVPIVGGVPHPMNRLPFSFKQVGQAIGGDNCEIEDVRASVFVSTDLMQRFNSVLHHSGFVNDDRPCICVSSSHRNVLLPKRMRASTSTTVCYIEHCIDLVTFTFKFLWVISLCSTRQIAEHFLWPFYALWFMTQIQ